MKILFAIFLSAVVITAFFVTHQSTSAQGFMCHTLQPGLAVQSGFGVPYDTVFGTNNQLINVLCDFLTGQATITFGDNNASRYIYELGYEYINGQWVPFTLTGAGKQGQWISTTASTQVSALGDGSPRYFVGYICNWTGSTWKCGCRDFFCNQSFWQMQAYSTITQAGNSSSSGGSSTGGFSSSSGAGATCGGGQCSACQACGGNCNNCGGNRTIWVDGKNGNDSNNGLSQGQAFKTIGKGANTVRGGDVMIVRPGKYYEKPTFSNLGSSANNPVWILSEVPGQAVISGLWREADQGNVNWNSEGNGVYSASHGDVYSGTYNNSFLFRYKSKGDLEAGSVAGVRKPTYGLGVGGGRVYIRLPGNANPNGKSIQITDQFSQVLVNVRNSPYVILDGFAIEGAGDTHAIDVDTSSTHVTLRNLNFSNSREGARVPNNTIFEWSEYSYPYFYEFADDIIDLNGGDTRKLYDIVKEYFSSSGNAHLEGGIAKGHSTAPRNAEFRYNYMHQVFDGEQLGQFVDSVSHHNVYNYGYDNHVQFESWRSGHPARNLRFHDNLLMNGAPPLSHQDTSGGMQGPHYVYRNVLKITDPKHSRTHWLLKTLNVKNKNIYYYHNTFDLTDGRLHWEDGDKLIMRNNIFMFDNGRQGDQGTPDRQNNFLVNNNNIGTITGNGGRFLGSNRSALNFNDINNFNFGLQSGSPAIDAGTTIPASWPDTHQTNGTPDVGAFEAGENPGNNWPRPRSTAYTIEEPDRWK